MFNSVAATGAGSGSIGVQALRPIIYLLCPGCSNRVEHQRGIPYPRITSPRCGSPLIRE